MSALIATSEGQFVKALPMFEGERVYGWHKTFGLIGVDETEARRKAQQRKGALLRESEWICRFNVKCVDQKATFTAIDGCQVNRDLAGWSIQTDKRSWQISTDTKNLNFGAEVKVAEDDKVVKRLSILAAVLFLVLVGLMIFWKPAGPAVTETVTEPEEAIVVTVKQQKIVVVASSATSFQTVAPRQVVRAVPQALGFLGLAGKRDLTQAAGGGANLNLKPSLGSGRGNSAGQGVNSGSAGAGAGGNAGSGGEMLMGLGRGVRATTVGNSGVQGLGGVGTKGKGGGLGGYGDVAIASGDGRGISSIGVSQGGVGVDGGLDRHVIQATIAKYLNQVRACYEDRLRVNPGLAGTLTMDFQIGPSGRLNFAKVKSSTVGDPQVGSCLAGRMMAWEFPKPRGGVNVAVNYPFSLRPVGQ
jgi:hypothetical protein